MTVIFPHAHKHTITDTLFLAAWFDWFDTYGPVGADPMNDGMPWLNRTDTFAVLLAQVPPFSVDVMCRVLVPPPYKNIMQATNIFATANSGLLVKVPVTNPKTGRTVNGFVLSDDAKKKLGGMLVSVAGSLSLKDVYKSEVDQRAEADIDVDASGKDGAAEVVILPGDESIDQSDIPFSSRCVGGELSLPNLIDCFIDVISTDIWHPYYRGKRVNSLPSRTGWGDRLLGYFWPNPITGGLHATASSLAVITAPLPGLVASVKSGTLLPATAVAVADDIFRWGGVPQTFTLLDVQKVLQTAISPSGTVIAGAPMNSGWTKLAAFATAHLPGQEHVIWDSRVANSVISRLDRILSSAGHHTIPPFLKGIGKVAGRGGSRVLIMGLALPWPNGYGKWACQFAASEFVRAVVDQMNKRGIPVPPGLPAGLWPSGTATGIWNVRMVEMVLFMDGY